MKDKKAIITVDLGFGDSGKGATVDSLCTSLPVGLVVRYNGGAQCAHNVVLSDHREHTFSQFGSGTFRGCKTHLGPKVLFNPVALLVEAKSLREKISVDPLSLISIDPNCPVTTSYHVAISRLKHLLRGGNSTCGMGIAETKISEQEAWEGRLYAMDLDIDRKLLESNLKKLKERAYQTLNLVAEIKPLLVPIIERDIIHLLSDDELEANLDVCEIVSKNVRMVDTEERLQEEEQPVVVFEGAQGVLLDEIHGFYPYVTWSNTTSAWAKEIIPGSWGTYVLGIIRSHLTRHGDGPLCSETLNPKHGGFNYEHKGHPALTERNYENDFQGKFRYGIMNPDLLTYAYLSEGRLDGLMVTHMECDKYPICAAVNLPKLSGSVETTKSLMNLKEFVQQFYEEERFLSTLSTATNNTPIAGISRGPTHEDREWKPSFLEKFQEVKIHA